jgi:hypothetical protein
MQQPEEEVGGEEAVEGRGLKRGRYRERGCEGEANL